MVKRQTYPKETIIVDDSLFPGIQRWVYTE